MKHTRAFAVALLALFAIPATAQNESVHSGWADKSGTTTISFQANQTVASGSRKLVGTFTFYYKVAGACTFTFRYAADASATGTTFNKSRHRPTAASEAQVWYDADGSTSSGEKIKTFTVTGAAEATLVFSDYEIAPDKAFMIVVGGTPGSSEYLATWKETKQIP